MRYIQVDSVLWLHDEVSQNYILEASRSSPVTGLSALILRNMVLHRNTRRREMTATRPSAFAVKKLGRCHKPHFGHPHSALASTTTRIRYDYPAKSDSLVDLSCILDANRSNYQNGIISESRTNVRQKEGIQCSHTIAMQ